MRIVERLGGYGPATLQALEEVFVQAVQRDGLIRLDTDAVRDEKLSESAPVDQLDPRVDPLGLLDGSTGEP